MAKATRIDAITVDQCITDPDGITWLETSDGGWDYDSVQKLPKVVEFEGKTFVQSGWNSDKGKTYYNNCERFATAK